MSDYMAMKADQQIEAGLNERDELITRIAELEARLFNSDTSYEFILKQCKQLEEQNAELKAGLAFYADRKHFKQDIFSGGDYEEIVDRGAKARETLASVAKKEGKK